MPDMNEETAAALRMQVRAEELARIAREMLEADGELTDGGDGVALLLAAAWFIAKEAHPNSAIARQAYADLLRANADSVEQIGHFSHTEGRA